MSTLDNFEDIESSLATDENFANESINIVIDHAEDVEEEDHDRNITIGRHGPMSRLSRIDLLDGVL